MSKQLDSNSVKLETSMRFLALMTDRINNLIEAEHIDLKL